MLKHIMHVYYEAQQATHTIIPASNVDGPRRRVEDKRSCHVRRRDH